MSRPPAESPLPHVMAAVTEVFGDQVRPDDSFFSVGGDSVAAVWLADLLEDSLGVEVELPLVLHADSFAAMADVLATALATATATAPADVERG
ncbi:acyl carrier protein [Streptacidiphilus sp. PB12-B1b]|uniref:acyl carrier protein n=1 Tax=Streptacidiphilus sp. PB12-B1b TaxID=2705012 RepID=UPI0015FDFFA9|nr:acyl carrier protein [Streptacidiphilus sp. PB12-B1b]QMU78225.1 acyl carrier protein [Streptacidiphilus sp. PB12-B1b]